MTYKELYQKLSTLTPTEQFEWLESEVKRLGKSVEDKRHAEWMNAGDPDPFEGRYDTDERPYQSDRTDYVVGNAVFMVDRYDLSLIHEQTEAKERIRWLSRQLYKHRLIEIILLAD